MNKSIILGIFALVILTASLSFSSADSNSFGTSYKSFGPSEQITYPSYEYSPSVTNKQSSFNSNNNAYSLTYQGPVIDRTTSYDEYLKIKGSKVLRTISARTSEKYIGSFESINAASASNSRLNSDYSSSSPNPTSYNGGSLWRYGPSYDYNSYGRDSYNSDYYYQPRYDSNIGYYNWRY